MPKVKASADIALLMFAAASFIPAESMAKVMGFTCHRDTLLQGNGVPIKIGDAFGTWVKSAQECFALCNKTQGCIAVSIIVDAAPNKPLSCHLFSKVIYMQKYDTASYGWAAAVTCVKDHPTSTLDAPPQNYLPIPNFPEIHRQAPYRPAPKPQPGPTPGGRLR